MATATAIEKTLRYGDLFDFPLKKEELEQYLIGEKMSAHVFTPGNYRRIGDYYLLPGREELLKTRRARSIHTRKKIARAIKIAHLLRFFPGVRMVGLTGSVAAGNAKADDDIDLMMVAATGRLWLTRALVLTALTALGAKRSDDDHSHHDNKFCFNLWATDNRRGLTMKNRDLYTAYEVCLMKPLLGGETYRRFLECNGWTKSFLPNFSPDYGSRIVQDSRLIQAGGHVAQYLLEIPLLWLLGPLLEPIAKLLMRRRIADKQRRLRRPRLRLSDHQLMFHPESPRQWVLQQIS